MYSTSPLKKSKKRNLENTPAVHEKMAVWPRGKQLLRFSKPKLSHQNDMLPSQGFFLRIKLMYKAASSINVSWTEDMEDECNHSRARSSGRSVPWGNTLFLTFSSEVENGFHSPSMVHCIHAPKCPSRYLAHFPNRLISPFSSHTGQIQPYKKSFATPTTPWVL
jgi:hypothetical protein